MSEVIEFTDRYGGNPPSWLRACHGPCEGIGWYPENDPQQWPMGTRPLGIPEEDGTPDDGWRFVRCPQCQGSGQVGVLQALMRVPRWFYKGIYFSFVEVPRLSSHWSYPHALWVGLRCAYWIDLVQFFRGR